jgi:VanZ family protein
MQSIKKLFAKRYPAILWTIVIFILLAIPGNMIPSEAAFSISNFDKYVHISIFFVFVLLWSFYFASRPEESKKLRKWFFLVFIIACLYGTAMEYVQKYFIPFRDFDLYDILSDVIGSLAGYIAASLIFPLNKKVI